MIALDEDMVGSDADTVVAQGLKVCLGLYCVLTDQSVMGAHFTPSTAKDEMDMMLKELNGLRGNRPVTWAAAAAKFEKWKDAASGLTTDLALVSYFRTKLSYQGSFSTVNMVSAPASYDVQCKFLGVPHLLWRATPTSGVYQAAPRADVFKLKKGKERAPGGSPGQLVNVAKMVKCDGQDPKVVHNPPTNLTGFVVVNDCINTVKGDRTDVGIGGHRL